MRFHDTYRVGTWNGPTGHVFRVPPFVVAFHFGRAGFRLTFYLCGRRLVNLNG